jgi:hypothetical protein
VDIDEHHVGSDGSDLIDRRVHVIGGAHDSKVTIELPWDRA